MSTYENKDLDKIEFGKVIRIKYKDGTDIYDIVNSVIKYAKNELVRELQKDKLTDLKKCANAKRYIANKTKKNEDIKIANNAEKKAKRYERYCKSKFSKT